MSFLTKTPHGVIPSRHLYDPGNGQPLEDRFNSAGRMRLVSLLQRTRRNQIVGVEFVAGLKVVPVASLPNGDYETDCIICRQSYVPEDPAAADDPVQLPCCGRGLHRECLMEWLMANRNSSCMICRKTLFITEPTSDTAVLDSAAHRRDDVQNSQSSDERRTPDNDDTEINEYDDDAAMNPNTEWELENIHFDLQSERTYEDDDSDRAILHRFSVPWYAHVNSRPDDPPLVPIEHYRELCRGGLDMLHLSPKATKLTVDHQLSVFRALQRAGAFELEGMRRMYWFERGWHNCMVFEHLMSKKTKWCVEHGRWFRETEKGEHRHLNFHESSRPRLGQIA